MSHHLLSPFGLGSSLVQQQQVPTVSVSDHQVVDFQIDSFEIGFEPIYFFKFISALFILLLIPLLSLHNLLPNSSSPHRSRSRSRNRASIYSAAYVPSQSTIDAPFTPLPTRRHFRISHVGNQQPDLNLAEAEPDISSDQERPIQYRLVFGKRLRGEESEFRGRSAIKGSRLQSSSFSKSECKNPTRDTPLNFSVTSAIRNRLITRFDSNLISFLKFKTVYNSSIIRPRPRTLSFSTSSRPFNSSSPSARSII